MSTRARLAVLISGRGRNLEALLAAVADGRIGAEAAVVISNRADAGGLDYAQAAGVPTAVVPHTAYASRAEFDVALAAELRRHAPDIVALAGFMRILGRDFVAEFQGRMLNIHPSLLPRHAGLDTHRRALEAGDAQHGATVHYVTEALDGGPPVIQGAFKLRGEDEPVMWTPEALAQAVLERIELKIYPQAVAWMARGDLRLAGAHAEFRGRPLSSPLALSDLEDAF